MCFHYIRIYFKIIYLPSTRFDTTNDSVSPVAKTSKKLRKCMSIINKCKPFFYINDLYIEDKYLQEKLKYDKIDSIPDSLLA